MTLPMDRHKIPGVDELHRGSLHLCPFLPDRESQRIWFRAPRLTSEDYSRLLGTNFRRHGRVLYRMDCPRCSECVSCRIPVERFTPSRAQRKCWTRNSILNASIDQPKPTKEKFELFQKYRTARHGKAIALPWSEYVELTTDSPVDTFEIEYRLAHKLIGTALVDLGPEFANGILFYFDPEFSKRSLGTFNILWVIELCKRKKIPYLYMGYYIEGAAKMSYKKGFRPLDVLAANGRWLPAVAPREAVE